MRNRERMRSAIAVLMSVSLALPPYTVQAEELTVEGGGDPSAVVIENGTLVEGSVGDNVILENSGDVASADTDVVSAEQETAASAEQQKEQPAAENADQQGELQANASASLNPNTVKTWYTDDEGNRQDMEAVALTRLTTTLKPNTWYVAFGSISIDNRLEVKGENTHLILGDGCKLELKSGLLVDATEGNSGEISIWGQSDKSGEMIATAGGKDQAGIGGNAGTRNGTVNIHNGVITATGKEDGAGIGGGENGSGGIINISGGSVTANADELGAGIGSGYARGCETDGGEITITGGDVTATGKKDDDYGSAGIGGGARGNAGNIVISGGNVTANGGKWAAGIGSGDTPRGTGGSIEISGGVINATSNDEGAGIGAGRRSKAYESITISGGEVIAACAGNYGAGIGGSYDGPSGLITISGGTINASAGTHAAGIGGGAKGDADKIEITGGNVTATAGALAAGIGGGSGHGSKEIVISGAETTVNATGGSEGAGIGSGDEGDGGAGAGLVTIKDGANVTATGGRLGAGIGGGDNSRGAQVTIAGAGTTVTATAGDRAAGIGGGEGKAGNIVDIQDDANVTAQAQGGYPAIGAGKGSSDNGTASLYPCAKVCTSGNDADAVEANKRQVALRNPYARVTPCQHAGDHHFEKTNETHKEVCNLCGFVSEEEAHDFDANGNCKVCGAAAGDTYYVNADGEATPLKSKDYQLLDKSSIPDTSTSTGFKGGWYILKENQTYDNRISVKGDVNLVLADGAKLTMNKGIFVDKSANAQAKLTIWVQKDGSGTLVATAGDNQAAIGGNDGAQTGDIEIFGGHITATGGKNAAGIGGGKGGESGNITIHGGTVDAKATDHAAGIGGGANGKGNTITITGGYVLSTAGAYAAGIGAGSDSDADTIKISGGVVFAWGGKESAGIGSANKGKVSKIEISGGSVTAVGSEKAAGIGGGDGHEQNGTYDAITISGKDTKVRAYGGHEAAGIGTGNDAGDNAGTIKITDGADVTAVAGTRNVVIGDNDDVTYTHDGCDGGAGIGGGDTSNTGIIVINGEGTAVRAEGASEGAGIGSGDESKDAGSVTITDGAYVKAMGGKLAAGIGGGDNCGGAKVIISGEHTFVEATGGQEAAGIGGGQGKNDNEVTIDGKAVVRAQAGNKAQAIGAGKGGKTECELKLYEGVCVKTGASLDDAEYVDIYDVDELQFQKLNEGCRAQFAYIAPCTEDMHEASEWHRSKDTHQNVCVHCGTVLHEEAHDYTYRGFCMSCGYNHCPIEIIDANGNPTQTDAEYTIISDVEDKDGATLESGWYVVRPDDGFHTYNNEFKNRLNIRGDVSLILLDESTLTCKDGIHVEAGSRLTIYGQKKNQGTLVATTSKYDRSAAIGSNREEKDCCGTIAILGGNVEATSKHYAAAIGGGDKCASGTIFIGKAAGAITATATDHAAGIGGGRDGKSDSITIEGGTVTAKGGSYAAGIGGGGDSDAGYIAIKGGRVSAWGGTESAGIGSANKGNAGTIDITGGDVIAFGAGKAAAIGGGDGGEKNGNFGSISISGGATRVRAYGGNEAAGIGSGNEAKGTPGSITISGGANVTAIGGTKNAKLQDDDDVTYDGGNYGAGIGGGDRAASGTVTITGDKTSVYAKGGHGAAGIGGGSHGGGDAITIESGTVTAKGGDYGAGIGAGTEANADAIRINGGTVVAWGGKESSGIGGANQGKASSIEIAGGDVTAIGAEKAAGIGGGDGHEKNGSYGSISISGDFTRVRAYGGHEAAGIGTGNDSGANDGTITISSGADVTAVASTKNVAIDENDNVTYTHDGCNGGAGIGGGDYSDGGNIVITDEGTVVRAEGAEEGAGIGSGDESKNAGTIVISKGADVYANGGKLAAGIGGGDNCDGGKVTISGKGTYVEAKGGSEGAGIGGGQQKKGGTTYIQNQAVVKATGADGGRAIGAGKDCGSNGGTSLYPNACVTLDDSDRPVEEILQSGSIHNNMGHTVTIAPCQHKGAKLEATEEGHVIQGCRYCHIQPGKTLEPHDFGDDCTCDICGYEANEPVFTDVTLPTDGSLGLTFWIHAPEAHDDESGSDQGQNQEENNSDQGQDQSKSGKDILYFDGPTIPNMVSLAAISTKDPIAENAKSDSDEELGDCYVELSVDGKWGRTVKRAAGKAIRNDKGEYGYTLNLSTLELADPVKATFHFGDKRIEKTSSFKDCLANAQRAQRKVPNAVSAADMNLMWATANLSHFVQPWLANCNKLAAGTDFVVMDVCKPGMNDVAAARKAVSSYKKETDIEGSGVKKATASLALDTKAALRVYLTPEEGKNLTASVKWCNHTYEARKLKDGRYLIEVTGINPEAYANDIVVKGVSDKEFTMSYSVLSYVNAALGQNGCSHECQNALTALYNYYQYANESIEQAE